MIIPPYLKKGDTIALVAPAKFVDESAYTEIIRTINEHGFQVIRGASTYQKSGPFAGSDTIRIKDLQEALNNPEVKAVLMLRGGYGSVRLIEELDFSTFARNPKWVIGYSDITVFHNALNNKGIASLHGPMALNFTNSSKQTGIKELFDVLKGKSANVQFEKSKWNRPGKTGGELVGGNLAILSSLIGTPYDIDTRGKILFIEEVGEYLYRFERFMFHLKLSGKLKDLSGLVVGSLTKMEDNEPAFDKELYQIIGDLVKDYDFPVAFNFPAGHGKENHPLVFGTRVLLEVDPEKSSLSYE